jgi:hypothetical protein
MRDIGRWCLTTLLAVFAVACNHASASSPSVFSPKTAQVKQQYGAYTVERAAQEGYIRDEFCLDAAAFGLPANQGAMGFHATNEALLRGPIDASRPQALMFDAEGTILGVEYEVTTDAVSEAPELFGRTFARLPAHPGVAHEHYALHLWFVDNPAGQFADFNPNVSCPQTNDPGHGPGMH